MYQEKTNRLHNQIQTTCLSAPPLGQFGTFTEQTERKKRRKKHSHHSNITHVNMNMSVLAQPLSHETNLRLGL